MSIGSRGDATELVTDALTEAMLCAECLGSKTGLPLLRVQASLERIAGAVKVTWREARCETCLTTTKVFSL